MRKHRFIGFVLTAATVAGPLSLSATTPASASVVISDGGASWRLPLINVPLSLRQALRLPGVATSTPTRVTKLFSEYGAQLPLHLGGKDAERRLDATRLALVQLGVAAATAIAFAVAQLAAPPQHSVSRVSVAPVTEPTAASSGGASSGDASSGDASSGDVWAELRDCESGGNYAEDTGNGFYGAYQFSPSTWTGLGYGGLPSEAPAAVQDAAAEQLQSRSGWGQWPGCSAKLGL
jgi:hypothetical protein